MHQVKSCGFIIFREVEGQRFFLLMKHPNRYDLPKGHIETGETERDCALRELQEETGINPTQVKISPDFEYRSVYYPIAARYGNTPVEKTLVIFLGWVTPETDIFTSEHLSYQWLAWHPPHQIQANTIDPLLAEVDRYLTLTGV
jgi:bis(5'-nucleosidyl)-tetraphosphatase